MKVLRNPFVVGLLVVIAGALVINNVLWPALRPLFRGATPVRSITQSLSPVPLLETKPAPTPPPAPPPAAESATKVDAAAARSNSAQWVAAPRRDPFQGRVRPRNEAGAYPAAAELLTLSAVWRQDGRNLAVINDRILSEQSEILDFKVAAIEADRVWVQGPNGREALPFKSAAPAKSTAPNQRPPQ